MPKYYAETADCRTISSRETAWDAAKELVGSHPPEDLGEMIAVSEIGYDDPDALWFDAEEVYNEVYPQEAPTAN